MLPRVSTLAACQRTVRESDRETEAGRPTKRGESTSAQKPKDVKEEGDKAVVLVKLMEQLFIRALHRKHKMVIQVSDT